MNEWESKPFQVWKLLIFKITDAEKSKISKSTLQSISHSLGCSKGLREDIRCYLNISAKSGFSAAIKMDSVTKLHETIEKTHETMKTIGRNHHETNANVTKLVRNRFCPVSRVIILIPANWKKTVSCSFSTLCAGFVVGFVEPRNRHETATKPPRNLAKKEQFLEFYGAGFFSE